MKTIISFIMLMLVKGFSHLFFKLDLKWISPIKNDYTDLRMIVFLHHTSLYEPLFIQAAPSWFLYRLSKKMIIPAADKTMNRPIVGIFWKLLGPGLIPITRKRDKSWFKFMKMIENRHIVIIAPEGRMKRGTGLDREGKPMSVRSGVAEIIQEVNDGRILIAYSGGLHHVQHPGQLFPRVFKKIKLNAEILEIKDYKSNFQSEGIQFRKDIVADLEHRMSVNCPS